MKIAYTGKTKELEFGINEIAEFLDFSIADGEYAINVIQEKDSDIICPKAPSGRELPTKSGEGECVTMKLVQI